MRQCNEGDSASAMMVTTPMQQSTASMMLAKTPAQCHGGDGDNAHATLAMTPIPQDGGEDAHAMAIMSMRQQWRQRNGGQDASATTAITHLRWG